MDGRRREYSNSEDKSCVLASQAKAADDAEYKADLEKRVSPIAQVERGYNKDWLFISFPVAEKVIYMQGLHQTAPCQWL